MTPSIKIPREVVEKAISALNELSQYDADAYGTAQDAIALLTPYLEGE